MTKHTTDKAAPAAAPAKIVKGLGLKAALAGAAKPNPPSKIPSTKFSAKPKSKTAKDLARKEPKAEKARIPTISDIVSASTNSRSTETKATKEPEKLSLSSVADGLSRYNPSANATPPFFRVRK